MQTLPDAEFARIYAAKCKDNRVRCSELQQGKFAEYMRNICANGRLSFVNVSPNRKPNGRETPERTWRPSWPESSRTTSTT